ncbi:LysR family transcriptional regulator [Tropicimonas marinistellae]|uniref:LysR family transcriptional regulator n=1 Tax=Tropicimonas marinistellae TaxID=1739787 RepID=UPI00082A0496|nr:LysR family transcriptional regulator [Tropicimonas marinistellae]
MKRLNALTFKQLRALRAVTRLRSISRAADELALTPPAVHSQLKALEENFSCAMLHRDGPDAFLPTPEGAALLTAFDKAEVGLQQGIHTIDALQKGQAGSVVLGVVSTAKYFAPLVVAQLKRDLPNVEVVLKVGNREFMMAGLNDGAFDLALMGRPPRTPPLTATALGDNPHVLIVPPNHRLVRLDRIAPEDILAEPFITREQGSGTRGLTEQYLRNLDLGEPDHLVEMPSNETIKQSVIAGLGISILSRHTVAEELHTGRLVSPNVANLPIVRKWYLLRPADRPLSGAVEKVHDHIVASIGEIFESGLS